MGCAAGCAGADVVGKLPDIASAGTVADKAGMLAACAEGGLSIVDEAEGAGVR